MRPAKSFAEPAAKPTVGWPAAALVAPGVLVRETPAGQPPAAPRLVPAFAPFLYFEPAHQALQQHGQPTLAFFLEDPAAGRTMAQLYVVPDSGGPGRARSPAQATFGGVQLAAGVTARDLHPLLDAAESTLRARGQRTLKIGGYPFFYDSPGAAALAEALRQRGYRVRLAELNYYLDLARDFEPHLHPSARRRLTRARQAGFVLEQEPPLLLPLAYEFIAACRAERGQLPPSLSLARVQELFAKFPRQHVLLSVREPGTGHWAALTVAIVAGGGVLHNFYPATPLKFNTSSPAILLTAGLHQLGRYLGLRRLDLGSSTLPDNGGPNAPLLRFKRHLGSTAGLKLSWEKELCV